MQRNIQKQNIPKPQVTSVFITPHAYQRFWERVDDTISREEATEIITEIALQGKAVYIKQGNYGQKQYVLQYKGLEILAAIRHGHASVITCYGDTAFAKWYRRQQHFDRRAYCA